MPSDLLGFITDDQRVEDRRTMGKTMSDESEVADCYKNTTARYCTRVASTLAFHPSRWQSSLLKWTKSGPFSDYAISDGVLLFVANEGDLDEEDRELNLKEMDSETRRIFDAMREKKDSLASWEIQGLTAGFFEVMNAVQDLGKFSWTYCDLSKSKCLKEHDKAREKVYDVKVGPDASNPPWNLPVSLPSLNRQKMSRLLIILQINSLDTSEETEIVPLASHSGSSMHPSHTNNKDKKRDDDNDDSPAQQRPATRSVTKAAYASESSTTGNDKKPATRSTKPYAPPSKRASYAKNKGKKRKRDDDSDYDPDDTPYEKAKKLAQRTWAQAVRLDGTFIVFHSGNWELVCVRDRKSQTLYVSDLIEPHRYPEYGKLQVGIYVAAIQETIDRKKQSLKHPEDGSNGGRGMRGSRFQGSARTLGSTDQLVKVR